MMLATRNTDINDCSPAEGSRVVSECGGDSSVAVLCGYERLTTIAVLVSADVCLV